MPFWGNIGGIAALFMACAHAQLPQDSLPQNEWSQVSRPSLKTSEVLGFYSNGCIRGAKALPLDGLGYQVMRISRNRYYGHPNLIQFITDFSKLNRALGSSLLVGDLGQPRGGPMPYGHSSHQLGLDVDIWFWSHPEQERRSLTREERDTLPFVSMLSANGTVDPKLFNAQMIQKLRIAAQSPKVERIFVNPAIKSYLCSVLPKRKSAWLRTLRPWPGHDEHFHVRLACPSDSKNCVKQAPVAAGDGCNELLPGHKAPDSELPETESESHSIFFDSLPDECSKVLRE
jgi:penicillin-insensitive murein endopeptidase